MLFQERGTVYVILLSATETNSSEVGNEDRFFLGGGRPNDEFEDESNKWSLNGYSSRAVDRDCLPENCWMQI